MREKGPIIFRKSFHKELESLIEGARVIDLKRDSFGILGRIIHQITLRSPDNFIGDLADVLPESNIMLTQDESINYEYGQIAVSSFRDELDILPGIEVWVEPTQGKDSEIDILIRITPVAKAHSPFNNGLLIDKQEFPYVIVFRDDGSIRFERAENELDEEELESLKDSLTFMLSTIQEL